MLDSPRRPAFAGLASFCLLAACGLEVTPRDDVAPLPTGNSADRVGVAFALSESSPSRRFTFDCADRCDVDLAIDVTGDGNVAMDLARPDGFHRREAAVAGRRSVRYALLAAGRYELTMGHERGDQVRVTIDASFVERRSPLPGGSASLELDTTPSVLAFACEESDGCDLEIWSERAIPPLSLTDAEGFEREVALEPFDITEIVHARVTDLRPGTYQLEGATETSARLRAEWLPAGTSPDLVDRLHTLLGSRQSGCDARDPDLQLAMAADRYALELSSVDLSTWSAPSGEDDPEDQLGRVFVLPYPFASDGADRALADTALLRRIDRCDRYGAGARLGQSGILLVVDTLRR